MTEEAPRKRPFEGWSDAEDLQLRHTLDQSDSEPPSTSSTVPDAPVTLEDEEDVEDYQEVPKRRKTGQKSLEREPSVTESDPLRIWTAVDDLTLITAVSHVSCIKFVFNTVTFSRKFEFADLEERFCQLMFDEKMSSEAKKRIAEIPSKTVLKIQSRTPFLRSEEKCLVGAAEAILASDKRLDGDNHTALRIDHFKRILEANRTTFHPARTPQVLSDHFRRIKSYSHIAEESKLNWEALENSTEGLNANFDAFVPLQACRERFHSISKKPALCGILNRFKTSTVPDNAIAMIYGRFLQFAMSGKTAVMGRASTGEKIDIDLSKEGPATKISRQQAVIRHISDGNFQIQNLGRRIIYVDCKPLPQLVTTSIKHGSIIEIAALRLLFSIPVPRVLHPLTRQCANQNKGAETSIRQNTYQQYQKQRKSTASRPAVVRRTEPAEKERLLKAVAGIGH